MGNQHVQRLKNIHILIIDDQPQEVEQLVVALQEQGARVTVASQSRKGIQLAQVFYPDLILLDVHMPDLDGFAACRLLREMPNCENTPVIFLTSAADVNDRVSGLTLGGADYILKPFSVDEVIARAAVHIQLALRYKTKNLPDDRAPLEQHPDQVILQAALRLIAQQLNNVPKLRDIAEQVGTHDKKLSAIFRERFMTTPTSYRKQVFDAS